MSGKSSRLITVLFLILGVAVSPLFATERTTKRSKRQGPLTLKVVPWGPSQADVDSAIARVQNSSVLRSLLNGTKFRQLEFEYIEVENKSGPTQPPKRFRVVFYDYTNDRSIVAEADFAGREPVTAREEYRNPTPTDEEFNE